MLLFEAYKLLDQPTSLGRLRAMARQLNAAKDLDPELFWKLRDAVEWLPSEDVDCLMLLAEELRREGKTPAPQGRAKEYRSALYD